MSRICDTLYSAKMRADRLLKMMLLLQTRGKYTAEELANALEVSVRTIYRDVNALSISGIPIYTDKGPGGGIQLIEDYRTSLTGFSEDEVKALFMLNVPGAMISLGVSDEIQRALLKLSASLPASLQEAHTRVRQRIIIDTDWLKTGKDPAPSYLRSLYQAVWQDRCIRVIINYAFGYRAQRILEAYGLVSRGEQWYLVCRVANHFKVFSLLQFESLEVLEETFQRAIDFDLAAFWQTWFDGLGIDIGYSAKLLIKAQVLDYLRKTNSVNISDEDELSGDGKKITTLRFDDFSHALKTILGLGNAVEVLDPLALRMSVADYARQIMKVYEE